MAVKIFFCYAHGEDEIYLNKIKAQLMPLQRQGHIETWHDQDISAGTEWRIEVNKYLNTSQIILLLVSPDFMASDYCYGIEMKRAIERHERGEARVIPIILRPIYWQGALGKLQALPKNAVPVTDPEWHNIDKALFNVAEGIRNVVEKLYKEPLAVTASLPNEPALLTKTSGTLIEVAPPEPALLAEISEEPIEAASSDFDPAAPDFAERVLVVAANVAALSEYLRYSVYICQPNRTFRQRHSRIAFYANYQIDRRVPKILGQIEAISGKEIETRTDLTDVEREKLLRLHQSLEPTRRQAWDEQQNKIIFLSAPTSADTLRLPNDVVNDLTNEKGEHVAFTYGHRYVSLSRLEKGQKTTSELIR